MGRFAKLLNKTTLLMQYDIKLHQTLRRNHRLRQKDRRHELHASLLDSDEDYCPRRAVFAIVGQVQTPSFATLLRFQDGDARHEKWQTVLDQAGMSRPDLTERQYVIDPIRMLCTPDKIIQLNGHRLVWECKGMNGRSWRVVQKRGSPPRPFVNRLHIYFLATGAREGLLHIDNKDTNEYLPFHIYADPALMAQLKQRADDLAQWYHLWKRKRKFPPRCHHPKCSVCREPNTSK